jgi:hypothetical protein
MLIKLEAGLMVTKLVSKFGSRISMLEGFAFDYNFGLQTPNFEHRNELRYR